MAKFKLYLLNITQSNVSSSMVATRIPISEFEIVSNQYEDNLLEYWTTAENATNIKQEHLQQRQTATLSHNPYFCYTCDEKFQLHQNTQRTLTFTMVRDIIREDRIEKNPFINYLYVGAQLLLEDKYANHHLMTVSKISYEFHKLNTVFKYECQDSFNYQLARQNAGYEITNNLEDVNFIGAKPLDWWVLCKIQPECNISYHYIKLNQTVDKIKTIAYLKEQYPEFHKTIPFAASGTASAVLIALGEQYGLQLHVYEHFNPISDSNSSSGTIDKYYWFEPMKFLRPSGLKYSPDFNLQSFGLEHIGTSFSSVFNVQTNTIGEDLIAMIPSVPAFFRTWFETEEWANSQFASGLFLSACQELTANWEVEENNIGNNATDASCFIKDGYLYIHIPTNIFWDKKYDQVKFSTNGGLHSVVHIGGGGDDLAISYNSKYQLWAFGTYIENMFQPLDKPEDCIGQDVWIQLELPSSFTTGVYAVGTLYLSQYREPTSEELEFATIADQIPWLENRLIDFKYFYDHSIINLQQYHDIMNIFENDLRKANAKLLLYSHLYYQSIQAKTKIMAKLSSQLDMVGATFQANLVKPFQTDGRAKETTEFQLALSDLFSNKEATVELIDYHTTLADYVNKYVTSEQTFLKNIYLFRQYFYEPCGIENLYQYTWTLDSNNNFYEDQHKKYRYAFTNRINEYTKLTSSNYQQDVFIRTKTNDTVEYVPFNKNEIIVDYKDPKYYYLNPKNDGYILIDDSNKSQYFGWNKDATYYELQWFSTDASLISIFNDQSVIITGEPNSKKRYRLELCRTENIVYISCYQHCLHTTANTKIDSTVDASFTYSGLEIQLLKQNRRYVKTNLAEMRQNYFYHTLKDHNTELYNHRFIHRHVSDFNSLLAKTQDRSKTWQKFNTLGLSNNILEYLPNMKNERFDEEGLTDDKAATIYAKSFPLTSWYYYGKKPTSNNNEYHSVPFINIENCSSFMRRISVSAQEKTNWLIWSGIFTLGISHAICNFVWSNGDKSFGNDGWSYHDVFNNNVPCFQHYYEGTSVVYASSADGYEKAVKDINKTSGDKLTINDFESKWGYNQATGILFTYNAFLSLPKTIKSQYYYKPSYWRILTTDDTVSKTDNLLQISLFNSEWISNSLKTYSEELVVDQEDNTRNYERLDSIMYYPLANLMSNISGVDLIWDTDKSDKSDTMILGSVYSKHEGFWLKAKNQTNVSPLILLKEEDYIYEDFSNQDFDYNTISILASAKYYDNQTMQSINLIQLCPDITKGYYITGLENNDYIPADGLLNDNGSLPTDIDEYDFYEKVNNTWVRRYNKNQLIARNDTYVRIDNIYKYNSFISVDRINVQCYRYINDVNNNWIFDQVQDGQIVFNTDDNNWQLQFNNLEKVILAHNIDIEPLSNYTNAEYWYQYRNSEFSILAEKAMLIETNLTEYWTNAYYASKNCKYFLPEFWQPTVDQTKNYYSVNILSPKYQLNDTKYELLTVDLSTTYVPIVTKKTGQHKFQFRHISQVNDDQIIAMEQQYSLPLSEHVSLYDIVQNSEPIKDIMDYLNISSDISSWIGVNIQNNHVLYEHMSGGRLWTKELQTLSGNALHYQDKFGGWYDMMIKVLLSCNYKNYSPVLYKQAQEEHNRIWAQLYSKYPYLLLEQSYSNQNATSPQELLQLAQYAFKDYTQVESNYNITVIDPWTLKGYKGQELQIGDGIEINAAELYDDHDSDIYRSLIQYLYITDISYDLRRDDNIQLTVNSIKYQDKVIGQLIKLIR